ncbi:MAG: HD domain-containing protein [Candidatus Eisenbacteria bacterium]|nr:HD domain-containing protein [Candidatus Eisenbacteria bacterium]
MSPTSDTAAAGPVRLAALLAALSPGLDLAEGQPLGHACRACLIGMRLGERLELPLPDARDLFFTLLLKDAGGPGAGTALLARLGGDDRRARRDLRRTDWACDLQALRWAFRHTPARAPRLSRARRVAALAPAGRSLLAEWFAARGAAAARLAESLGFGPRVAQALRALDEHGDGSGEPRGLRGDAIPVAARIAGLAQALDALACALGPASALEVVRGARARWFDPDALDACAGQEDFLARLRLLDEDALQAEVAAAEPGVAAVLAGPVRFDRVAEAYAALFDAAAPSRAGRTARVAELAAAIAAGLGWSIAAGATLRRVAWLHDIGILSVPNRILESRHPLTPDDWDVVRLHPWYSRRILERVPGFGGLAAAAAAHHERLDGRGYPQGLRGGQVPQVARVLAAADIYEALTALRPFRAALTPREALALMRRDRGVGLAPECVDALAAAVESGALPAGRPGCRAA